MTKNHIRENFSLFKPDINAIVLPFWSILGETNSNVFGLSLLTSGGHSLRHGLPWCTTWYVKGLSLYPNINHLFVAVRNATDAALWADATLITPLLPHIQHPYYAAIASVEVIGLTGSDNVFEINVNAIVISDIYQYGCYLPGGEVRNTTHIHIDFSGPGLAAQKHRYANATSGIT
ncbi:hypothetical protein OG21DRAFT_1602394 [Imleria badia]|nr:hypothetical protein OG21DRAFT_1602394 [Imleria badia]